MKSELEPQDIEAIADKVIEKLKPILSGKSKEEIQDIIFDLNGLCSYLHVSDKWVYERTHLKEIPYMKVKGLLRFRKKDIDKWLNHYNVPAIDTSVRLLKSVKATS